MNNIAIAVAIHLAAIVWWIGGVAMVTTVVLPAALKMTNPVDGLAMFQHVEKRFSWHARAATILVAASGFYLVYVLGFWSYFLIPAFWWLGAMVFIWAIFTIVLFIVEPLFVHQWLESQAEKSPSRTLLVLEKLHWFVLVLSFVTLICAALGSHGVAF